jgi:hypothetical protein
MVVLVDHAAEHLLSLNRQVQRSADLAVLVGWSLLAGLVRAVPAVMAGVFAEDRPQVPFVVDEHPVGALGSCGAYPPLCAAVHARVRGGVLTTCTHSAAKILVSPANTGLTGYYGALSRLREVSVIAPIVGLQAAPMGPGGVPDFSVRVVAPADGRLERLLEVPKLLTGRLSAPGRPGEIARKFVGGQARLSC